MWWKWNLPNFIINSVIYWVEYKIISLIPHFNGLSEARIANKNDDKQTSQSLLLENVKTYHFKEKTIDIDKFGNAQDVWRFDGVLRKQPKQTILFLEFVQCQSGRWMILNWVINIQIYLFAI